MLLGWTASSALFPFLGLPFFGSMGPRSFLFLGCWACLLEWIGLSASSHLPSVNFFITVLAGKAALSGSNFFHNLQTGTRNLHWKQSLPRCISCNDYMSSFWGGRVGCSGEVGPGLLLWWTGLNWITSPSLLPGWLSRKGWAGSFRHVPLLHVYRDLRSMSSTQMRLQRSPSWHLSFGFLFCGPVISGLHRYHLY